MRGLLEGALVAMSLADKKWAKLADEQQFTRLESIHTIAGNWRNGLLGLTALVATVTIIKGPEKADELSVHGKRYAAILLGVALFLLLLGSFLAMYAAFGLHPAESLLTGESLRHWTAKKAHHAKLELRYAVVCFFAAVAALAGAIAVTWFDEGQSSPPPMVVVV